VSTYEGTVAVGPHPGKRNCDCRRQLGVGGQCQAQFDDPLIGGRFFCHCRLRLSSIVTRIVPHSRGWIHRRPRGDGSHGGQPQRCGIRLAQGFKRRSQPSDSRRSSRVAPISTRTPLRQQLEVGPEHPGTGDPEACSAGHRPWDIRLSCSVTRCPACRTGRSLCGCTSAGGLGAEADTAADTRQYVREPDCVLPDGGTTTSLDTHVRCPESERLTAGYERGEAELWFGEDGGAESVYVVFRRPCRTLAPHRGGHRRRPAGAGARARQGTLSRCAAEARSAAALRRRLPASTWPSTPEAGRPARRRDHPARAARRRPGARGRGRMPGP